MNGAAADQSEGLKQASWSLGKQIVFKTFKTIRLKCFLIFISNI